LIIFTFISPSNMSRHIPIPTATKRAIDVPSQLKLLYREPATPQDREEFKRKLEQAEQSKARRKIEEEPEEVIKVPLPIEEPSHHEEEASSSSSSSEDDEEELLWELARIKQERAEAEAKRLAEQATKEEEIANANPLLSGGATALRRRWDDDTVFRGQASRPAGNNGNKFVNDAVRTQSHKKFLNKYVV
jgi:protein CWC15